MDHLVKQESFERFFECDRHIGYGMVASEKKMVGNENKNEKSKENAYAAIQAILNFIKSEDGATRFGMGSDYCIFVPIIAIRGKLIEARLNANDEINCKEIQEAQIHYKENINGTIPKIHVVTEKHLQQYIQRLCENCDRILNAPFLP